MVCTYCGSSTTVRNSRPQRSSNSIWRRRLCLKCGSIFTTEEKVALSSVLVVRRGSALEPFSRDYLFLTVYESCKHRPRALSDAGALTQAITNKLLTKRHDGVIDRDMIAEIAHGVLMRFDKVAGTVYAAFHQGK